MIGRGTKKHGMLATGVLSTAAVLAVAMACETAPPTEPAQEAGPVEATLEATGAAEATRQAIEVNGAEASPLVYVDGIRVAGGRHALDDLKPDAIERIEVIKGGAAESLFGAEAADGVIQIFLKREGELSRRDR